MRLLPAVGHLEYNGVTFPGPLRASIQATPQYDTGERSVKYVRYMLKVETMFTADDWALVAGGLPSVPLPATDPHVNDLVEDIRIRLTSPGMTLFIQEKGFGLDVRVNGRPGASSLRRAGMEVVDSKYGPTPRLLEWQPVGDNRTVKVVWEVEFNIPECIDKRKQADKAPVEKTFNIEWRIDQQGLTVRTISGRVEVPLRRYPLSGGNKSKYTADDYRHYITFPVPHGFKRSQRYRLSDDRRSLDFTLEDTELPSDFAFYHGTLDMEADFSMHSEFLGGGDAMSASGFTKWDCRLSARITLPRAVSKGLPGSGLPGKFGRRWAWLAFKEILNEKIWHNVIGGKLPRGAGAGGGPRTKLHLPGGKWKITDASGPSPTLLEEGEAAFVPVSMDLKEDLYGRTFNFDFSYWLFCMPDYIFDASRFANQNGPGTGKDFEKYLHWAGGGAADFPHMRRGVGAAGSHGPKTSPVPPKPFLQRGDAGTAANFTKDGRVPADASKWSNVNTAYSTDFIYKFCSPTHSPWKPYAPRGRSYRERSTLAGIKPEAKGDYDPKASSDEPSAFYPGKTKTPGKADSNSAPKLLIYDNAFTVYCEGQTVQTRQMGSAEPNLMGGRYYQDSLDGTPSEVGKDFRHTNPKPLGGLSNGNLLYARDRPKIQHLGPPSYQVRVKGQAYQMGYSMSPPSTLEWGSNCTLHQVSKQSTIIQVAHGELPVYLTTWDILYNADNSPDGLVHQYSPKSGGTGNTGSIADKTTGKKANFGMFG